MRPLDLGLLGGQAARGDGEGRALLELSRALIRRGHRVTIYTHHAAPELQVEAECRIHRRMPGPQLGDDIAFFVAGSRALRRRNHDLTCVNGPYALPRDPFVYYAHYSHTAWQASWSDDAHPGPYHAFHSRMLRRFERVVLARSARVFACSRRLADDLGVPADRVEITPNGVDPNEYAPTGEHGRATARDTLGIPRDAYVVAFVGEFRTKRKGLPVLIEAIARGGRDERLVVAGDGDRRHALRLARRAGIADRLHVLGVTPSAPVFAAADVAAVPSTYEPFSMVAIEAAATGIPVVLSSRAGAADHLDGAAILLDRPTDAWELRGALDMLRAQPALATELGAAGIAAARRLRWDVVADRTAELLEDVAVAAATPVLRSRS